MATNDDNRSRDVSTVLREALGELGDRLEYVRASIVLVDAGGEAYLRSASYDGSGGSVEVEDVPVSDNVRRVVREGRGLINCALAKTGDRNTDTLLAAGIRSTIVTPLVVDGRVIGTFNLGSREADAYDTADLAAVQRVADAYAPAVSAAHDVHCAAEAAALRTSLMHSDRLASLGQLVASVAHEINNPAAFVLSNLEHSIDQLGTLRDSLGSANTQADPIVDALLDLCRESLDGVVRIGAIVSELQAFSRVELCGDDRVRINEVVRAAARIAHNSIQHRARFVIEPGVLPDTMGNSVHLTQLVLNLLMNACQAIEPGRPEDNRIEVATWRQGDELVIRVSDTGCGIPEDRLEVIFQRFYTTKPPSEGTGLGLAVCKDIVRRHGGHIEVRSELGVGTCFYIHLPCHAPAPSSEPADVVEDIRPGRVLLVDDDPAVLDAIRRVVERHHRVETAGSAGEALARIAEDPGFDVILCDVTMPGMSGIAFHQQLGVIAPGLLPRLVFLTGGAIGATSELFLRSTQNVVLHKPVRRNEILAAVAGVMETVGGDDRLDVRRR